MTDKTFGPYLAQVVDVHDGDTVTLDIDLGFDHIIRGLDFDGKPRISCRIYGINAPELSTPEGKAARAFLMDLLQIGDLVHLISHSWDKFGGRYDGEIKVKTGISDDIDVANYMIKGGHAKPYFGQGPKPV